MINLKETKPGQVVYCISNKDSQKLVLGEKYVVKEILDDSAGALCVENLEALCFDHNFSIESPSVEPSSLLKRILNRNQNNFRLTSLKPLDSLSPSQKAEILGCLNSNLDKAHHALGFLLWGFISSNTPVAIISCNDLDELIQQATVLISYKKFSVMSFRGKKTIWAQLTALMTEEKIIQILKPQVGRSPAVIEITHPDWLRLITRPPDDDLRLGAINSTSKEKFNTLEQYFKSTIPQVR